MRFGRISEELFGGISRGCGYGEFLQSIYMYRRHVAKGREVYLLGVKQGKRVVAAGIVVCMRKVLGQKVFVCARGPIVDYSARYAEKAMEMWLRRAEEFVKKRGGMVLEVSPPVRRPAKIVSSEVALTSPIVMGTLCYRLLVSSATPQEKRFLWDAFEATQATLVSCGYKDLGEYEQVKWIYTLDPRWKSEEELLRSFRKGHKLSIRYATERYGVKIRRLHKGQFGVLKELVDEAGERHHFRAVNEEYFEEMRQAFTPKNTKFILAEMPKIVAETGKTLAELKKEGKISDGEDLEMVPVAGAMFVEYGGEIVYLFSGSKAEYKKYGGPHLIQWEMIKYARKKGLRYNFYGTKPVEGDGVHAFKTGFHGRVEEYVGTFVKPLTLLGKLYLMRKHYQEFGEVA